MQTLSSMPDTSPRETRNAFGMPIPHARVLRALSEAKGPLTRAKLSGLIGNKTNVVVGRAIGYSDPEKRAAFEQTKDGGGSPGNPSPSLLTLGYVREKELDIDGLTENVVELTPAGRAASQAIKHLDLPPMRDSWND